MRRYAPQMVHYGRRYIDQPACIRPVHEHHPGLGAARARSRLADSLAERSSGFRPCRSAGLTASGMESRTGDSPETGTAVSHLWGRVSRGWISPFARPNCSMPHGRPLAPWGRIHGLVHGMEVMSVGALSRTEPRIQVDRRPIEAGRGGRHGRESRGRGGTYANLFGATRRSRLTVISGCTAGIAEMLLQSHDGRRSRPSALPDGWSAGSVKA